MIGIDATANDLLGTKRPEDLFDGVIDAAKRKYHELALKWHPDKNLKDPKASNEVFQHIKKLFEEAVHRIESGTWQGRSTIKLKEKSGNTITVEYLSSVPFELGHSYIGKSHVTYLVDPKYRDLFDNAVKMTARFEYANDDMKEEVGRYLPSKVVIFETKDKLGMIVPKTPDVLLLRDVLRHFGGSMDSRQVAWILSTLQNLVCYLHYAGISHQNISPDTYFISPAHHSGLLLGGWWYATKFGRPVSKVPNRTYDYLPWDVRNKKVASELTDLDLIRVTGRELLGDITGMKLDGKFCPKAMVDWLRAVSSGKAVENYSAWKGVLKDSFGPRKFVKMDLDATTLYNQPKEV